MLKSIRSDLSLRPILSATPNQSRNFDISVSELQAQTLQRPQLRPQSAKKGMEDVLQVTQHRISFPENIQPVKWINSRAYQLEFTDILKDNYRLKYIENNQALKINYRPQMPVEARKASTHTVNMPQNFKKAPLSVMLPNVIRK